MKVERKSVVNEDIENLMKDNNKNLKQSDSFKDAGVSMHVDIDPTYGQAIVDEKNTEKEVEETMKEVAKNSEGVTPESAGTGKKVKTPYTESIELDESLFDDEAENLTESQSLTERYVTAGQIASEIESAVEWLKEQQMGCSTFKLDNRLAVCTGWSDGYDPNDTSVIHDGGNGDGTWAIVTGIKVWTSDDLRTDYDFINYPYFENGDVWDTGLSISPNENYNETAEWLLKEYQEMSEYDIDEDGLIIDADEPEVEDEEDVDVELTSDDMEAGQWYEEVKKNGDELTEVTDTEIDDRSASLWRKARERQGTSRAYYSDMTDDERKEAETLSALRMINSVLAYLDRGEMGRTGVKMEDGAKAVLDAELSRSTSYLQKYVDSLGYDKVVELIQGQIDDIDTVEKNAWWDDESGYYNSIKWKRDSKDNSEVDKLIGEAKTVEDLPDTVYELAYDRLFPAGVKNYKALILSDSPIVFDEDRYYVRGLGDWDIGVAVQNDQEADFVKKVADFLGGKYEFKETALKDGLNGVAIIRFDEETANMPSKEYMKKIGYEGAVRKNPNANKPKKKAKNESLKLDEDLKVITTLKDYEPWSGARPWYDIIVEQGKLDALDAFLEEQYPDGIEDGELNDLIWFSPEFIFEGIGINYDFDNDRLIDDEEESDTEED